MADLGDYVQVRRKPHKRGELVQKFTEGWVMVLDHRSGKFFEEHEDGLVTIVKGEDGRD